MTVTAAAPAAKPKREQLLTERERAQWRRLRRIFAWLRQAEIYRLCALRELARLDDDQA